MERTDRVSRRGLAHRGQRGLTCRVGGRGFQTVGKSEGRLNPDTGKVETGKVAKGHSTEQPKVAKHFGLRDTVRTIRKDFGKGGK